MTHEVIGDGIIAYKDEDGKIVYCSVMSADSSRFLNESTIKDLRKMVTDGELSEKEANYRITSIREQAELYLLD